MKTFNTRTEVINALSSEFNHNPAGFNNTATNSSIEKFWTLNRLRAFYWDIKRGRKETYKTQLNKSTGYYELKPAKMVEIEKGIKLRRGAALTQ